MRDRESLPSLESLRHRADPLADAAVAALKDRPRPGENVLVRVREGARRGDVALERFVDDTSAVPAWVDFEKMEAGRRAAMRHSPITFLTLLAGSLVETFAVAKGAKVLLRTGRLLRDPVPRMYETASMLRDVMRDEGSLRPGRPGHEALLRVRLLHSYVRRFVGRSPWDEERDGVPINQMDMVHTLMAFSLVLSRGMEALGARMSDDERESWCHLWRFAGRLLGVDDDVLFDSVESERALYAALRSAHYAPDEGSRSLCFAVLDSLDKEPPFFLPKEALYAISRRALGDELADSFGLPRSRRWSALVSGVAAGWRAGGRGLDVLPLGRAVGMLGGHAFVEVNRWRVRRQLPDTDYSFRTA